MVVNVCGEGWAMGERGMRVKAAGLVVFCLNIFIFTFSLFLSFNLCIIVLVMRYN